MPKAEMPNFNLEYDEYAQRMLKLLEDKSQDDDAINYAYDEGYDEYDGRMIESPENENQYNDNINHYLESDESDLNNDSPKRTPLEELRMRVIERLQDWAKNPNDSFYD